ncbi:MULTISPECIES: oxygen-insensitive NADPH nitroreductase [Paenibacillus]|uniref:FMN reductase n=1 Tax=Paenibacillus naphthalenovorans TaxID=162209 RepID=A0A0U2UJP3_9BACL|nr:MULTISPECIES: oxygen-insensitive NADPH nitroreductase [Paenibacillus]ALS23372.1 FMN reductase [Paenibacillus naphthalenovorans]GCL72853.1 oxygen-insensitive NADPH nitroreductase [Paenibacillus naphthalenovorans]SDI07318.1 FMN reductase (NADPH) [Paenibacillus naphthalenovorans]
MNQTIELLKKHRSIRKFKETAIPEEHLTEIILAAQAASTSSNIQAYSVIAVKDPERKRRFAGLAGNQQQIVESPVFLVWCADLNKIRTAIRLHEDVELKQNVELFLLGTIDATLAAQNATVAAESLGYGMVYIGGIRNNPQDVTDLLELPQLVYPVFGMCLGVPDQEPDIRPRLPLAAVYHQEVYSKEGLEDEIKAYDEITRHYYATRKGGGRGGEQETKWSKEMLRRFNGERLRGHMHDFLLGRGFELK